MSELVSAYRSGFPLGYTAVTHAAEDLTGISFGILKLQAGASHQVTTQAETAFLLMLQPRCICGLWKRLSADPAIGRMA